MSDVQFAAGREFLFKGHRFVVADVSAGMALCHPRRGGEPWSIRVERLKDYAAAGKLEIKPMASPTNDGGPGKDLDSIPKDIRNEVERRLAYVLPYLQARAEYTAGLPKDEARLLIERIGKEREEPQPHYVTVTRWVNWYRDSGQDVMSLVPRHDCKGNRRDGLSPDLHALMEQAIDKWLTPEQPTLEWVHGWLVGKVAELNENRADDNQLPCPSRQALARRCYSVDVYTRTTMRNGEPRGKRILRTRADGPKPTLLLERVEIDHSTVDLIVIDEERNIIGRPHITVAIDKLTRMVIGVYISLAPPSYLCIYECIKSSLQSKDFLKELYPDIRDAFDAGGIAVHYVADNGRDFRGDSFSAVKETLKCSISFMPPRRPWFKGSIERWFASHNKGLVHNLPGTTKSNILARADYDSMEAASLTLADFKHLFFKWLVDVYMNTPHRTTGQTPRAAWRRAAAANPPRFPVSSVNLDFALGEVHEAAVHNGRIIFEGLQYWSPALSALNVTLPKGQRGKRNVKFKVNTSALDVVHVVHPDTHEYFPAQSVDPGYTCGLSLHLHRALQALDRAKGGSGKDAIELGKRAMELVEKTDELLKKPGKTTRVKTKRTADALKTYRDAGGQFPDRPINLGPASARLVVPDLPVAETDTEYEISSPPKY